MMVLDAVDSQPPTGILGFFYATAKLNNELYLGSSSVF